MHRFFTERQQKQSEKPQEGRQEAGIIITEDENNSTEKTQEGPQEAAIIITEDENNSTDQSSPGNEKKKNNSNQSEIHDTGTDSNENGPADENPWPYLHTHFKFLRSKGKNLEFLCLLCRPNSKMLSANKKSLYNLKQHVKKIHSKTLYDNFMKDVELGVKGNRQKRTRISEKEGLAKKSRQSTLESSFVHSGRFVFSQNKFESKVGYTVVYRSTYTK